MSTTKTTADEPFYIPPEDDMLPGETIAEAYRRIMRRRKSGGAPKTASEPHPRNLALLAQALDILLHGRKVGPLSGWSARPPRNGPEDEMSARQAAGILLAGLQRSLRATEDAGMEKILGTWRGTAADILTAEPPEWRRLWDVLAKPTRSDFSEDRQTLDP